MTRAGAAALRAARQRQAVLLAVTLIDRPTDSGLFLPPQVPDIPSLPDFDPVAATRIETWEDASRKVREGKAGEQFLLAEGDNSSSEDIQPRAGQYIRGHDPTKPEKSRFVGAGKYYFVRAGSEHGRDVVLQGFTVSGYGMERNDNGYSAILAEHTPWSKKTGDNWTLADLELYGNGSSGVQFGNYWAAINVRADDHRRTGFQTGGCVGGNFWFLKGKGNGWHSGEGALVDGAQFKGAWINGIGYRRDRIPDQFRKPEEQFTLVAPEFDCSLYPGRVSNNPMRSIWFDLDCRLCLVVGGESKDGGFAVFVEGCNGVDTIDHTAIRCGMNFWRWDWDWPGGAFYAGDSTNVDFIDCTAIDCDAPMITKLGNRQDWFVDFPVAVPKGQAVAGARADSRWPTGLGAWLTPTLLPIPTREEQSNVGTGNIRFIRTKVIGKAGHVGASESLEPRPHAPNVKGQTPWDTIEFIESDYSEVDGGPEAINFHWQHRDRTFQQWQELGHDLLVAA